MLLCFVLLFFCCCFLFILFLMLQGHINTCIYSSDVTLSYLFNPFLKSGLHGIKLFPLIKAESFYKELDMHESNQEVTKTYIPYKQCQKTYQVHPVLLITLFFLYNASHRQRSFRTYACA